MRTFIFDIDQPHLRAVNETRAQIRGLQISAIIFGCLVATGFVALALWGKTWSIILSGLLTVISIGVVYVIVWAHKKIGSLDQLYQQSPLVPAIVAEVRPRGVTLLALVDLKNSAASLTSSSRFALVTRSVRDIPGHQKIIGEKVPSVSIFGATTAKEDSNHWGSASPIPLCWGTQSTRTLLDAQLQISAAEWDLLRDNIALVSSVAREKHQTITLQDLKIPSDLLPKDD
ncbi:MAG: DUF3239 domain-containing protein [Mycobacteriaceae bacterium]